MMGPVFGPMSGPGDIMSGGLMGPVFGPMGPGSGFNPNEASLNPYGNAPEPIIEFFEDPSNMMTTDKMNKKKLVKYHHQVHLQLIMGLIRRYD